MVSLVAIWVPLGVVLGGLLVLWLALRGLERERDAWKTVADDLARALRAEPGWGSWTPQALARYNALLEPEA